MKKDNAITPVNGSQQLEEAVSVEIVELEDELLGDVFGGNFEADFINFSQCKCVVIIPPAQ